MPPAFTLADIASRLGGRVAGDPAVLITQVGSLENALPDQIAFLANPKYRAKLASSRAGAVVVSPATEDFTAKPRLVCDNPYAQFARISRLFNPPEAFTPGIDPASIVSAEATVAASVLVEPGATIASGATIGEGARIGPGVHVGRGSSIGAGTILHAGVTVYPGCTIGARCVVHAGAVIGADGFGFARDAGEWVKIPQIGRVRIGDDVEIGANTTIDRGAIDDTVIEDGVKLDNQIQVGHNVRIGAHTAIAGCVGIAGSADIGRHCTIGAASVVLGHLSVADHVDISAGTVVTRSLRKPGTYTGLFPMDENARWARNAVWLRRLDELATRVKAVERHAADEEGDRG